MHSSRDCDVGTERDCRFKELFHSKVLAFGKFIPLNIENNKVTIILLQSKDIILCPP
jgi:hypothetical protein